MSTETLLQRAAAKVRERAGKEPEPSPGVFARLHERVVASPEQRLERLAICEECPHAIVSRIAGRDIARCGACGCPLASRTHFKNVHCPKGKW